jgi:tetratricopeptide (TPR) repeat protein
LAVAEGHLLAAYGDAHQLESARQVADLLINQSANCSDCMLNVAALAVEDGDLPRLKAALKNIERTLRPPFNPRELQAYVIATGQMHELQGDLQEAIYAYQDAIRLEPLDPMARLDLALLEARQGLPDARKNMEIAQSLFTPDQRRRHRAEFEKVVAESAEPAPASSSPPPRH